MLVGRFLLPLDSLYSLVSYLPYGHKSCIDFHTKLLNELCKMLNYSLKWYCMLLLIMLCMLLSIGIFSPHSEETEKGHLAGTKENVFGKYSDGFPCHLSVINPLNYSPPSSALTSLYETRAVEWLDVQYVLGLWLISQMDVLELNLHSELKMVVNNWKGPVAPEVSQHKVHLCLMTYTPTKIISSKTEARIFLFNEAEHAVWSHSKVVAHWLYCPSKCRKE